MFKKLLNWLSGKSEEAAVSPSGGMHDIESFVDYVARSLVDSPEAVKVRSTEEADVFGIQIICKKEDRGKIIGRRGKTINAIRALANGAAGRMQKKVTVEVID